MESDLLTYVQTKENQQSTLERVDRQFVNITTALWNGSHMTLFFFKFGPPLLSDHQLKQ